MYLRHLVRRRARDPEAYAHWLTLKKAAILELDLNRLPQRIKEVQSTILDRNGNLEH